MVIAAALLAHRRLQPLARPHVARASGASALREEPCTDGAIAPDASAIVYCLQQGETANLHLVDLTKNPPTDAPITNDGKSCHPFW